MRPPAAPGTVGFRRRRAPDVASSRALAPRNASGMRRAAPFPRPRQVRRNAPLYWSPSHGTSALSSTAAFSAASPIAGFADVQALASADMQAVNALIRTRLASDVVLVNQVAEHIIGGGGKRLRPLLHLVAARAAGYRGRDHIALAAVIEFIHTATLLHDDVVDESDLRRGRKTANAVWGNAASVLVGDFLYSRSFQMMVELDRMRVMRILADTTNLHRRGRGAAASQHRQSGYRRGRLSQGHRAQDRRAVRRGDATRRGARRACRATRRKRSRATASISASRSRSPTTCSTTSRTPARSARTSATISPKASRRCR